MKHLFFALAILTNFFIAINQQAHAENMGHGGGNGGSDVEMQLAKRAKQIGYFLKSKVGSDVFKMLNPTTIVDVINSADIDVIEDEVKDKYDVTRTCVNEPGKSLITCNLKRILELGKHDDILTAIIFHEILGLMEIELGHEDNVSMYPISSKILPYHDIVKNTPISEAQIRPEFFGLDNRSYGVSLVNKETKESLRLICLNDNVEIHRCRNYSLVRQAQGLQAPAIPNIISISPTQIASLNWSDSNIDDVNVALKELEKLKSEGVKYLTLTGTVRAANNLSGGRSAHYSYRYGAGLTQMSWWFLPLLPAEVAIDTVVEGGKQVINITAFPIKALIKGIQKLILSNKISKINKKVNLAKEVLNVEGELSLIGTKKSVSDEDFKLVLSILTACIQVSSDE